MASKRLNTVALHRNGVFRKELRRNAKNMRHSITHVIKLMKNFREVNMIWRERRALARLDESQLKDIGLHPLTARRESKRHYFDVPVERLDQDSCEHKQYAQSGQVTCKRV